MEGRHLPTSAYEMSNEVARAAVVIDAEMHADDGIVVERSFLGRRRLVIEHPEGFECRVQRLVMSHDPQAVLVE